MDMDRIHTAITKSPELGSLGVSYSGVILKSMMHLARGVGDDGAKDDGGNTINTILDTDDDTSKIPSSRAFLLIELWGEVFKYVNDFTLWVMCRQVSKMFRAEAEREYRITRLSKLKVDWYLDCYYNCEKAQTTELVRVSEDGSLAYFHFVMKIRHVPQKQSRSQEQYIQRKDEAWEHLKNDQKSLDLLDHSDVGCLKRFAKHQDYSDEIYCTLQRIRFGPYCNNVHVRWEMVDYDRREIPIDWKKLINDFFAEEAYIRHKRKQRGLPSLTYPEVVKMGIEQLFERLKQKSKRPQEGMLGRISRCSAEEDDLRQEACEWRLKRAYAKAGMELELGKKYSDMSRYIHKHQVRLLCVYSVFRPKE